LQHREEGTNSYYKYLVFVNLVLIFRLVYNFLQKIIAYPDTFKQLNCGEVLITQYNCPLENAKQDLWSHHNYFVYVLEGKKTWHTVAGSFLMMKDDCLFVKKGASIVEQFFDGEFCVMIFFVPDHFVCNTLKEKMEPSQTKPTSDLRPAFRIQNDLYLHTFFASMLPYFSSPLQPDQHLLELKFKELIWNVALNPANQEFISYFCSLHQAPSLEKLKRVMEDNYCYNLPLSAFAELCDRSLAAFKRDFEKCFQSSPGKWLMNKRLEQAKLLLTHTEKAVGEVAFELGFENLSHFSKAFKTKFNHTPVSLRQKETA